MGQQLSTLLLQALRAQPDLNPFAIRDQTLDSLNTGGDKGKVFLETEFGALYRLYFFCGGCVQEALAAVLACLILAVILLLCLIIIALLLHSTFRSARKEKES